MSRERNNQRMEGRRKVVRRTIESLKEYINTYEDQKGYEDYSDTTIIDDMLYGLGVAMGDEHEHENEYKYADGFDRFKDRLRKHLGC